MTPADEDAEIRYIRSQNLGWMKQYISSMNETNWRDLRLLAERKLDEMISQELKIG